MAKQHIKIGDTPNDRTGDPLREAFRKVNENFDELYGSDNTANIYHLGDDLQFVDIDPDSGTVVIQSGFDTGMPVYIKGANCSDEGFGGDVIIEAGGAPLPNNGTTGVVSIAAREVTIETEGGTTTFTTGGGGAGYVTFPEVDGTQLGIQGSEITSQPGSNGLALTAIDGNILLTTHADVYPALIWEFDRSGTINTPLLFPLSFTAVLDVEHRTVGTGTYTGPAWEFNLEWQVSPSGQIELMSDTGPLPSLVVGYADGQTFEFTEADHGIPNYILTVELYDVVHAGPAGWTANLSFSEPPAYPSTINSAGAIKLTSNGHSIVLGTDGYLTTESIHLQGSLKGVDGNTGTTGQVLTRQSNGGVAWENATGGGGGGLSISDFGRGFTDTLDSGKITTNKLYNRPSNLALNNHFELSVTDGGVVILPDQSIINGATLKTVSGGWAGITAGPVGKDEDSWVWVDNDGATITTKYSTDNHTWTFNNNGGLTFPQGTFLGYSDPGGFIIDGAVDKDIAIYTYSGADAHGWTFGTDGTLTVPGDIKSAAGVGPVVIEANDGTARTWTFGGDGTLNLPESISAGNAILQTTSAINIQVNSNAHEWTFGTDGLLTFPGADGFQATFGSVEPVGDVLHSVNSLYLESEATVGLTSGADVEELENTYIGLELTFGDIRDQDAQLIAGGAYTRPWTGLPSYEAYDLIMAYNPVGVQLPPPGSLAPAAYAATTAYYNWQSARTSAGVLINVADKQWVFGVAGDLRVPGTISKTNILQLNSSGTGGGAGNAASVSIDGDNGRLLVRTSDSETNKDWIFGLDGTLTLPAGGDIKNSAGASVLGATLTLQSKPTTKEGQAGDLKGMIAIDSIGGEFYYCIADYTDGADPIWAKVAGSTSWI